MWGVGMRRMEVGHDQKTVWKATGTGAFRAERALPEGVLNSHKEKVCGDLTGFRGRQTWSNPS